MKERIKEQFEHHMIGIDHVNIGLLILGGIAFLIIAVLFYKNSKEFLSHVSDSLKDPKTGKWSGKIISAFMVSALIFIAHIVWLKFAFVKDDFSQLQPILIIDYSYLTAAFGLRTLEKMQDAKINKPKDAPPTDGQNT